MTISTLRPPNAAGNSSCIAVMSNSEARLSGENSTIRSTSLSGVNSFLDAEPNRLSLAMPYFRHSAASLVWEMRSFSATGFEPFDVDPMEADSEP